LVVVPQIQSLPLGLPSRPQQLHQHIIAVLAFLRLSVTMRQAHLSGDKLFVDYAGDTVPVIVDRLTPAQ
jgi:hypothetical protein